MTALMIMRDMPQYIQDQQQKVWGKMIPMRSIMGSRFTMLGAGDIAITTAKKLRALGASEINGVSRSEGENSNCWKANGQQGALTLKLAESKAVSEVRLVFDPNLSKSIKLTLSSVRAAEQVKSTPSELVRDYDVVLLKDGAEAARKQVRGNLQRLNIIPFDAVDCDAVRIETIATHGAPDAVIFEVRIY